MPVRFQIPELKLNLIYEHLLNILINFCFKKWPSCKVEALEGVPDMMNDFSSISYEIEHILEEVRQPPYHIGYKYIKQYYLKITI